MKSADPKIPHENDTASAVETAGTTGAEGLSAAPLILERLLRECPHRACEEKTFADAALNEVAGARLVRTLRQAYAIVEDGHAHLGLIYPEARSFIEPVVAAAAQLAVVYEYGAAWIHTAPPGSPPIIESRGDGTVWDFSEERPSKVQLVSLYVLDNGHLRKLCTKPARGFFAKEVHC